MNTPTRSVPYTVVVPALNEEETIGDVLKPLRDMTDDLVVVDGHSSDGTREVARTHQARVVKDNGRGKGDAVRTGLEAARHPITVFIDADGSHDPDDIPTLVEPIAAGEADLVMGSRMLGGSEELFGSFSEVIRLIGSLVISLSINYRYGVRFTDYQNGFRAIRTRVGRAVGLTSDLTTIEQEMAMKLLRYGYRVTERPTHEYRRQGGVSKIRVMQVAHIYIWNLLKGILVPRRDPRTVLPGEPYGPEDAAVAEPAGEPDVRRPRKRAAAPGAGVGDRRHSSGREADGARLPFDPQPQHED